MARNSHRVGAHPTSVGTGEGPVRQRGRETAAREAEVEGEREPAWSEADHMAEACLYLYLLESKITNTQYSIRAIKMTKDEDGAGYYPQKTREVFEQRPGDLAKRREFSRWLRRRSRRHFFQRLISIDEAMFSLDGRVNHQCHR